MHKGHHALISTAKEQSDACVVILSSNFTQRGSPAIIDKFTRAQMAIEAGADLVLELPFLFACSAGQDFARGAAGLLAATQLADTIAFGMEDPDADITAIIRAENSISFSQALRRELDRGASFAKAHSLALESLCPGAGAFTEKPNNLLALSYVRETARYNYKPAFMKIKRKGIYSGSLIRENLSENLHMLPDYSQRFITSAPLSDESKLWPLLQSVFLRSNPEDLRRIYGVDEGIEGLFLKHWRKAESMNDFIGRCVCARYTRSHIRRRLVYILLGLDRWDVIGAIREGVPYARVLAFNNNGRKLLRNVSGVRVITRLADTHSRREKYFAEVEYKASQLYELTMSQPDFDRETRKPVIYNA